MSNSNIAKFSAFVIFLVLSAAACGSSGKPEKVKATNPNFEPPKLLGKYQSKDIVESSGAAASRCNADVIWTHNDNGNDNSLYAVAPSGALLATYRLLNTKNRDWEDIASYKDASGKCFLYIGDIGDNDRRRTDLEVYRIPEPPASGDPRHTQSTETPEVVKFTYPDAKANAETLMVHPVSGDIYVVTKLESGPASVYKVRPTFGQTEIQKAEKVGEIAVPAVPNGLLTGGDISPDGRHVALCDYTQGYELTLPAGSTNFDDIWRVPPEAIDIGKRPHGEGITYNIDGSAIIATSEEENAPIYEIRRRQ